MKIFYLLTVGGLLTGSLAGAAEPALEIQTVDTAAISAETWRFGAGGSWEQVTLTGPVAYELPDGTTRTLNPSCSAGPVLQTDGTILPADPQFSFFIQRGHPSHLLFGMDGGGACWDAFTCIASPLINSSTYSQTVDETPASLANAGGAFDGSNRGNPFRHYTKIFIPYCSADVHWGSRDTTYTLATGGGGPIPWTIRHRGVDNFLAALAWLQDEDPQPLDLSRARHVTVAGASAGGYGTNLAFAYIAPLTPKAKMTLVSDAAIGVVNESFLRQAFYDPAAPGTAVWGVEDNLPTWVPGFDLTLLAQAVATPNDLVPAAFEALANYRPQARFASLTSNLDTVQIGFYALMENRLGDPTIAIEWYQKMAAITAATASIPNYRYNIDAGTYHTLVATDSLFYSPGASGVSPANWSYGMLDRRGQPWDNLDAGPPAP